MKRETVLFFVVLACITTLIRARPIAKMSSSTVLLFAPGPNPAPPAKPWRADDFVAVNDQVRGGSSQSHMTVIQKNDRRNTRGEIEFSGFLDTLTLGGAGFASQAYENSFQVPLTRAAFSGLRLVVRRPVPEGSPTEEPIPGGGKAPVSMFNLNLKTEKPARRQDGRRESSIVWEWNFELPGNQTSGSAQGQGPNSTRINDKLSNDEFLVFDSTWDDFQATFRGRPADPSEAGELKPEKTVEWSIMARSNFQSQSGPFALRIHSLSGIKKCEDDKYYDKMEKRGLGPEESASTVGPARRRSGEYYGFALFILATVLYVVWMIWGLTPDWLLRKVGVGWYPNRCVMKDGGSEDAMVFTTRGPGWAVGVTRT